MKKIYSVILTFALIFAFMVPTLATNSVLGSWTYDGIDDGTPIVGYINQILGIVTNVCVGITVGMLLYLGIKYTTASANEKADVKNASIKFLIGAIIVLGSTGVFSLILKLAGEISGVSAPA